MTQIKQITQTDKLQQVYSELAALLATVQQMHSAAIQTRRGLAGAISPERGDTLKQIEIAAAEYVRLDAQIRLLPSVAADLQQRVVVAHGAYIVARLAEIGNDSQHSEFAGLKDAAVGYRRLTMPLSLNNWLDVNYAIAAKHAASNTRARLERMADVAV